MGVQVRQLGGALGRDAENVLNFSDRPGDVAAGFPPAVWERLLATRARYDPAGMFVASQQVG